MGYLNGHTHTLNQYTIDYQGYYVTSGAGAMVNTPDQEMTQTKEKWQGITNVISSSGHSYQTVFNEKIAGFTLHTFNEDFTSLTTELIAYNGNVIHTFTQDKYSDSLSPSSGIQDLGEENTMTKIKK